MDYNTLDATHINALKAMVSDDRFSTGESVLKLHAKDQSHHKGCRPEAVIWPQSTAEVVEIITYANANHLPVVGWGSGSSLEGNPIPVQKGLVLDFTQMNRILDVREADFQVDVEPGVVYQDLNEHLKDTGLFFPPDPGARATIGGMIANNASGTRTVHYGSTKDYVLQMTIVLASGEILEMGRRVAKTSSGYDLPHLFIGSEGTLGIVVKATLRLVGLPEEFSAAVVTFPSIEAASKAVSDIVKYGLNPGALELMDSSSIELFNKEKSLGLEISPTLFIEFHGPSMGYLSEIMDMAEEICKENGSLAFSPGLGREARNRLFEARHELGEMIIRAHPDCRIQVLDAAVPISAYPEIIALARQAPEEAGIKGYAFSHAGDGNLHLCLAGRKAEENDWKLIDDIGRRLVSKAISLGGTATGEHGVGIGKRKYMPDEHGSGLEWMKNIKSLFDPNGILNPGKIFP